MAALTIRNLDESIKSAIRVRAAQHGISMEEEARRLLREAVSRSSSPVPMGQCLLARFGETATEDFSVPERHRPRVAPEWD
ncbi:FitA-like ribbon-helix-helix domain-containing protein [Allochromatium vinosum]|uniref:Resolvase domain protein n=1 Tax=Allochromatium vinosum (strain ATCC 17899 / DSM 180 / NBRC 103801 / NCIMB 10441 / D) TaxID=572477 RepID=D3RSG5_ALLVD|nr:plasmid stabilization protein [Allochromatium vinosum]ADC62124.1 resolvase domain protein [Allochromatium vinosum DSM 180]